MDKKYQKNMLIMIIISFLLHQRTQTQELLVDLQYPSLIDSNQTNIKCMGIDTNKNILVGLDNLKAKKYNPTFTNSTTFTLPDPPEQIQSFNIVAGNATSIVSNVTSIVIISNQRKTLRSYADSDYQLQYEYSVNETINQVYGFPLKPPGGKQHFFVLICQKNVKFAMNNTVFDILNVYKKGQTNLDAAMLVQNTSFGVLVNGSEYLSNQLYVYILQSNGRVYLVNLNFTFVYNSSRGLFFLHTANCSSSLLVWATWFGANIMFFTSNIIFLQNTINGVVGAMYKSNTYIALTVNNVPQDTIYSFISYYNSLYLLQYTGLTKLVFSNITFTLDLVSVISLPDNFYNIVIGQSLSILYIFNQPFVYNVGYCTGQNFSSSGTCTSFICRVSNCSSCPFDPNICGYCDLGIQINTNMLCIQPNYSPTPVPFIYSNQTNSTLNYQKSSNIFIYFSNSFLEILIAFLNFLLSIIKKIISVPGARRVISPLFYYFGVFDDIYFYQFHDRAYGGTMNSVFDQLNQIQTQKWSIISYQSIVSVFSEDLTSFNNTINYQSAYLTYNFTTVNHTFLGTESFLGNCQNFAFVGLPFIIVGFMVGHFAFRLLFSFQISKIFRKLDFWLFVFLLIFDGNVQQFSFYLSRDLSKVFAFQFDQKLIKLSVTFFGFLVVLYSISMFFLSSIFYKRLSFYFNDNNRRSLLGVSFLVLQYGFKNMVIGVLQTMLRPLPYFTMLTILFVTEVVFLLLFLVSVKFSIYKKLVKIWLFLFLNLLKLILIFSFIWDFKQGNFILIESIQQVVLFLQISLFLLSIVYECVINLYELRLKLQGICKFHKDKIQQIQQIQGIINNELKQRISNLKSKLFIEYFPNITLEKGQQQNKAIRITGKRIKLNLQIQTKNKRKLQVGGNINKINFSKREQLQQ